MARRQPQRSALDLLMRVTHEERDAFLDDIDAEERLLPSQVARPVPSSPEKALALAVMVQGIQDAHAARRCTVAGDGDRDAVRAEALAWLKSDDVSHLYAFRSLCDLFGWDAAALRAGILARLENGTLRPPTMRDIAEPPAKTLRDHSTKRGAARPRAMRASDWERLVALFDADPDAYAAWRQKPASAFYNFLADERDAGRLVQAKKVA